MARSHRLYPPSHHSVLWLVLSVFVTLMTATNALADKRVALVLESRSTSTCRCWLIPDKDAAAMSELFRQIGFDVVTLRHDLGVIEMRRTMREFAVAAADADMAVVYYAGHGIEVDGANYLIPADAKLLSDFDIEDEAIPLDPDRVLQAISPAKRLRLVILMPAVTVRSWRR